MLTGVSYSVFLLLFRAANRRLVPPAGPLLDATAGGALGLLLIGLLFDPGFSLRLSWPAHGWLLLLALLPQTVGWLLIAVALPRLPALETSVLLLLQPMAAVLWGFVIFHEVLSALQWGGVVLVLLGVVVLTARGSVERARPAPEALAEPVPPAG